MGKYPAKFDPEKNDGSSAKNIGVHHARAIPVLNLLLSPFCG